MAYGSGERGKCKEIFKEQPTWSSETEPYSTLLPHNHKVTDHREERINQQRHETTQPTPTAKRYRLKKSIWSGRVLPPGSRAYVYVPPRRVA
jgi:hypothetical protein